MAFFNKDEERKQQDLKRLKKDVSKLADFLQLLTSTWSDTYQRIIGVIALNETKFKDSFQGNSVYLAGKYTLSKINLFFNPNAASNPPSFKYPDDHLFRLSGCVDLARKDNTASIVAKHGQSTDLTFGRFSELEAYTCDELKHDSWEVAVLNFSKKHSDFSSKGDSGAAIFNIQGKLVAILHSGITSNHVTFGTPGHYVVELVKKRYPHADFDHLKFDA